jgi:hypothetical protein
MTRTRTLALLAASAAFSLPTGASAQFGRAPSGSYTQSCQAIQTDSNGYLSAECRADSQGRYRWSTIYAPQCRGDISNRSGMLACDGAVATGGEYVSRPSTGEQVVGAILGSIFGVPGAQQELYGEGYRYPQYGQQGYGDPRYDARYGQGGWGYGAPAGQFVSINERRTWLEQRISQAERQGSLSRTEGARLRTEFADLVRLEASYRTNAFTAAERQELDRRFDSIAARVRGGIQQGGFIPISQRRDDVERRIDQALRQRQITPQEAARLRTDFEDLVRLEANYRQGGLTTAEQAELDRRFAVIEDRLDDGRDGPGRGPWTPMAQRQNEVYAGIDRALRDRRITTQEATRLRTEFQALVQLETSYGPGRPSRSEQAELDRRFDGLADRIGLQRQDDDFEPWRPLAERQTEVYAAIDEGLRDRRITVQEATRLRTEFQDLMRLETSYRPGGINSTEQAELERRFDLLANRIGLQRQDDLGDWEPITQRTPNLATRIDTALRNGALTTQEAAQLRSEYQNLLRLESTYSQGGYSASEQAALEQRYEDLRDRIRTQRR